jgi:hypothetical protein
MTAAPVSSHFPGGTSVSNLAVYDWLGPDGLHGGSPHVHLACTEGYAVVGGRGRLQTLDAGGFTETPLEPLTVAWFAPGTIHRLVNDGELRIVVIMQNGGLPEAGDCVLTFPPDKLVDTETYRRHASLANAAEVYTDSATAAQRRRDLAVEGFLALRERVAREGGDALDEFYQAATRIVGDQLPSWREVWEQGALRAARRTGEVLDRLDAGDWSHLRDARLAVLEPPPDRRFGMCGRLATYDTATYNTVAAARLGHVDT